MVRVPLRATVVSAVMSSWLKSAELPLPSAMTLPTQFASRVHKAPVVVVFQVPLAANAGTEKPTKAAVKAMKRFFWGFMVLGGVGMGGVVREGMNGLCGGISPQQGLKG